MSSASCGRSLLNSSMKASNPGLLLQQICAGGASGFLLQGQVHALVTAVLLGMTRLDAFDADA